MGNGEDNTEITGHIQYNLLFDSDKFERTDNMFVSCCDRTYVMSGKIYISNSGEKKILCDFHCPFCERRKIIHFDLLYATERMLSL